jgi:serine/threonine protein kinase
MDCGLILICDSRCCELCFCQTIGSMAALRCSSAPLARGEICFMAVRIESLAEPLPGYRLLERLGGGGFGEVWKCEAPGGLLKAIKFVHGDISSSSETDRRAEQELKALSRVKSVRHPYILSLERFDILDGQLLIVMELADRNLWDRFKEYRARGLPGIPREELLGYLEETAEALDLMNIEYQLQHLDIKPQNIFLVHNHIKVADFGLVKDLEGMRASMTGGITPVYAAPETFDGWVSRYCDQYSLAIVYQELLTGQRPFTGNNVRQLILQHMQAPPNVEPLPPADRPAIARSLSKTPNDRFPSCRDLVAALKSGNSSSNPTENGAAVADAAPTARAPSTVSRPFSGNPAAKEPEDEEPVEQATACLLPTRQTSLAATLSRNLAGSQSVATWAGRQCPPEINGTGVLFPSLIIGLGHLGMTVVQRLNQELHRHLGGIERLPHLRLMVLDTDPEVTRAATRGTDSARLREANILLAPLNRPSHYLKTRDGRPDVESWLHKRMLYRIPRSLVTTGVRALGRLAFYDNYPCIMTRLQTELDACLDPEALSSAVQQTGLGLRTNRVRVYLIASLAGGTGSGMFVDLAYNVRALLKQAGYQQPDVVGLLLLPNVDRNRTRTLTLGNACAALRELSYFARRGTQFTAKYHPREPALQDSDPPFGRTILLPLPDETDELATRRTIEAIGLFLARDLCSSLGPAADLGRGGMTGTPWESRGLYYQTFGLHQLSWPRHELLGTLARRLCQRLIRRWVSKDSKPIREGVRAWVEEQWTQQQLGSSLLVERLSEVSRQEIGQNPEEIFQEIVRSLASQAGKSELRAEQIAEALEQFEQLLGTPQDDGLSESPGRLVVALREAADKLVQEWGQKLAELPVRLIEAPEFRLAGAEEAIRQMIASIERTLQNHEPLARELAVRASELHDRLLQYLVSPIPPGASTSRRSGLSGVFRKVTPGSRKSSPLTELQQLLRDYPKTLYQSLMLRQAGLLFLTLRGHLADEMREINFCRNRLGELLQELEEGAESTQAEASASKHLYPLGCNSLNEAVERFGEQLNENVLNDLDARVQAMLNKQFTALVNVCLAGGNALKSMETAMLRTAEEFVAGRLGEMNVAEMFLKQHKDDEQAVAALTEMFHAAAPQLPAPAVPSPQGGQPVELCVLAAPANPAGEHLRALAAKALPNVEWQAASSEESILLYRELANLPLSQLPQLGPVAQDAYRQMSNAEHFTPHCRCDVNFGET